MLKKLTGELITLLYMLMFVPQASGGSESEYCVPWLSAMRKEFQETKDKLLEGLLVEGTLDRVTLGLISEDLSVILSEPGRTYSLQTRTWLYLAQVLDLCPLHRGFLEQILTAWDQSYSSKRTTMVLGRFNPSTCQLTEGPEVPVGEAEHSVPFWRWYGAFVHPATVGMTDDALLCKLDEIFSSLFVPCLPKAIPTSDETVLYLPLPNISQILTRAERVFPKDAKDIGQLRPWAALTFFTFGFRRFSPINGRVVNAPDALITARFSSLTAAITQEAERLAKCNDKDFSNAHVVGTVEHITDCQRLSEEQVTSLLKRNGISKDPDTAPGAPDVTDGITLGLPNDDYQPFFSSEADTPSGALDSALSDLGTSGEDGEPSDPDTNSPPEEETEEGGEDPSSAQAGDVSSTDNDAQAATPAPAEPTPAKNPQFRKLWGSNPIKLDTQHDLEATLYKAAVDRMNDVIQRDPGDAVEPQAKAQLDYWCDQWLWLVSTQTTARLIRALKLEKYLKA